MIPRGGTEIRMKPELQHQNAEIASRHPTALTRPSVEMAPRLAKLLDCARPLALFVRLLRLFPQAQSSFSHSRPESKAAEDSRTPRRWRALPSFWTWPSPRFGLRASDCFRSCVAGSLGTRHSLWPAALALSLCVTPAAVIYETTSPYHHIRVVEQASLRTLCFDDAQESRMSVPNPLQGHFEYTEYFHMPWLWNTQMTSVVMIGLGGASTQRSFEFYYPNVTIETAEIDPVVVDVARQFFDFRESDRQKVQVSDGRVFLRRSTARRDLIILDA